MNWSWLAAPDYIAPITEQSDAAFGQDRSAQLPFVINAEPTDHTDAMPGAVVIGSRPARDQLLKLLPLINGLIDGALSQVPPIIRSIVAEVVKSLAATVLTAIKDYVTPGVLTLRTIDVTYHLPPVEEPLPPAFERPEEVWPGSWGQSRKFCAVFMDYLTWEKENFAAIFGALLEASVAAGNHAVVPDPQIQQHQATVWAAASPALADLVHRAMPFGVGASVDYVDTADVGAAGRELQDWAVASCGASARQQILDYREWAHQQFGS